MKNNPVSLWHSDRIQRMTKGNTQGLKQDVLILFFLDELKKKKKRHSLVM